MILAAVNSGRSLLVISADTKLDTPDSDVTATFSTEALPPEVAAAAKAVPRTVSTLTLSPDLTVA